MSHALVVDDLEDNLYYLSALLGGHGYSVETARNGAEALDRARARMPDLVVSDLLMPVMDGFTLLRHWHADPALRSVPFVVYTATYTSADDEALALSLGADAFIIKPAEPDALMERLQQVEAAAKRGSHAAGTAPSDGAALTEQHNAALVRKLEKKMIELEATNAALTAEIAERRRVEALQAMLLEELTQAREDSRAAAERLETLVAEARIGILVQDGGRPVMANDALARMFGYAGRDEVLALAESRTIFDPADWPLVEAYNRAQEAGGGPGAPDFIMVRGRRQDGALIDLEDRAFAIRWGDHSALCSMLTDVTEQRRLEAVARQAQRLDSLGQVTGGIAHDFNNLLTVILGNSELLEEELAGDPDRRPLAEVSRKAAERGVELTSRLLAFSRQQALHATAVDLNALIAGLRWLLRRAVGAGVEIETRLSANPPLALIDAAQFENALLNLCVNARDAMPSGGRLVIETGTFTVTPEQADAAGLKPGRHVTVAVSDTGTGMDEATRHKAFDPFFTTKEVGKGSGLGLSMVHGFVQQSGGQVRIASRPGAGTTITLTLPHAAPGMAAPPEPAKRPTALARGQETILVVDDDELVRDQAIIQLRRLGYDVVSAATGAEALALLRERPEVRLLFSDLMMPGGMTGRDLAEQARQVRPGLPVLLTSGYAPDSLLPPADGGGFPLLRKPYQRQELADRLRALLEGVA